VAANINAKAGETGGSATARTEIDLGTVTITNNTSYTLKVLSDNQAPITVAFTVGAANDADGLAAAINAFNDKSSQTGVTARLNDAGTGITITNASGNDIRIDNTASSGGPVTVGTQAATAGNSAYVTGELVFDSDKTFGLTNTTGAGGVSYFAVANAASQLQSVNNLDVSTVDASNRTLAMVDSALSVVSGQRARYGALQARFETTISNLNITSESMSAARSRIQDADFAAETANLSRAQILQQAGTAMVAQANQIPQGVLQLLK